MATPLHFSQKIVQKSPLKCSCHCEALVQTQCVQLKPAWLKECSRNLRFFVEVQFDRLHNRWTNPSLILYRPNAFVQPVWYCTFKSVKWQPWRILWKTYRLTHPEPSMLPGLYRVSAIKSRWNGSFQICKSNKVVTLTCSIFWKVSIFEKYSLPFVFLFCYVWKLVFSGKVYLTQQDVRVSRYGTS